jgi:hypothetical protein
VAALAIELLDFRANMCPKGFRKFGADHFFRLHPGQVRQDFISNRNS